MVGRAAAGRARFAPAFVTIGMLVLFSGLALWLVTGPGGRRGTDVSPQFFGQDLMSDSALDPAIPVRAMRLWDSHTQWCQIDTGRVGHQYDFAHLDALLDQASRLKADVEFTFGGTPQWAADGAYPQQSVADQCSPRNGAMAPTNESYWTNFVTALASHARGRIHAYELWNEADSNYFWAGGIAAMVKMSVVAAAIIHRIDPSAVLLAPSISNTPRGYAFLHRYLSLLPAGTIGAIAVHSYTSGAWPEEAVPRELRAVRAALPNAYLRTPIWSTEGGWGENSRFSRVASDQTAFIARYDLQMLAEGVARTYWYGYPNSQWGTLWNGRALTPAGIATATLESWLTGAVFTGCRTDGNLWMCDFVTSSGRKARILWVTTTPLAQYRTAGSSRLSTLDGRSWPTNGAPIAVSREPSLLSS